MRKKSIRIAALAISMAALLPTGLSADNFTIETGARHVQQGKSDMVAARKADLAIAEVSSTFSLYQPLDYGDENKFGANRPFLALSYRKDFGKVGLQLGMAYESFAGDYSYTVANVPGKSGNVITINGTGGEWKQKEQNKDIEIGLRLPVVEGTFFLTPRIGTRLTELQVTGNDSIMGISGAQNYEMGYQGVGMTASARGTYAGLTLDWNLSKIVDLYAGYTLLPGLTGDFDRKTGENVQVLVSRSGGASGSSVTIPLYWKSNYKLEGTIVDAGLKWKIGDRFFIKTGYRRENTGVSYPGYALLANTTITIGAFSGNATDIVEPLSNALLYGKSQTRSWETFSLSVGANVDFGSDR